MDVTGINHYKKKGVLTLEDMKKDKNDYSNILYSKSYIVDGYGKAVVCAVGKKSQFSMNHVEIQELTLKEEQSPIKNTLQRHRTLVNRLTNYFILIFMITYFLQRIFFHAKMDKELDLQQSFQ